MIEIKLKAANIALIQCENLNPFTMKATILVGMTSLLTKLQTAAGRYVTQVHN